MDRCLYVAFLKNTAEISGQIITEAYMDLNPERGSRFKTRITVVPFIIFLLLFLFAGFTYLLQANTSTLFEANISKPLTTAEKKPGVSRARIRVDQVSANPQILGSDTKTSILKNPVIDFLKAYNLSIHENIFFTALKTGSFQKVSEIIFSKTGYQLICLEQVPDQVKSKYGVLSYPNTTTGKTVYFLFWKPTFRLKKFYYSYRGREIQKG